MYVYIKPFKTTLISDGSRAVSCFSFAGSLQKLLLGTIGTEKYYTIYRNSKYKINVIRLKIIIGKSCLGI